MSHIPPRAVFFDLDQTLIQHSRPITELLTEALIRLAPTSADAAAKFEATLLKPAGALWQRFDTLTGRGESALQEVLATTLESVGYSPSLATRLLAEFVRETTNTCEPSADAYATLDALTRAGIATGIITNGFTFLQKEKARALGLLDRVKIIVTSEDAGAHKPDRRIFDMALRGVGVQAAEAWYVGDSYDKDIRGACNVGMTPVLMDPERQCQLSSSQLGAAVPAHVISNLFEVTRLIAKA